MPTNMHRPGLILSVIRLILCCLTVLAVAAAPAGAQTNSAGATNWVPRPLSLADALNVALQQNGTLQKAKADLEASHGIVMQTRAIVLPRLEAFGNYLYRDKGSIETFPFASPTNVPATNSATPLANQNWEARIQVVQSIYEGGRMWSPACGPRN
jgi:outer membrane protein TolC